MLDQSFWESRWKNNQTAWDIGTASPAITNFMKQFTNKEAAILIPGCGNAHEAEWLLQNGFKNITLLDIAPKAVQQLQQRYAEYDAVKVVLGDFFEHRGQYDLMIEQTFFCAIHPSLRSAYVAQSSALLNPGGKIIGLLFNTSFPQPGPPFGGSLEEYQLLFQKDFHIKTMENCINSIKPRANTELFIHFIKT